MDAARSPTHSVNSARGARPARVVAGIVALAAAASLGCTSSKMTHTARTGVEQMLVSNAVDQALDKTDFSPFSGQNVYIEEKYMECVDKQYILGSIRHRTLKAGANLVAKPEEADVVIEPRSGSVGTDSKDTFVGMPSLQIPGPLPISIPEIRLFSRTTQFGTAKLGMVAYDAKSKQVLGEGGVSIARADDSNWSAFGLGPYQNGSLRRELSRGTNTRGPVTPNPLPYSVAFSPRNDANTPGKLRLTGGEPRRTAGDTVETPAKGE
ncbi:MAG: hypothetical protein IT428_13745 [Planctomycetaceae bacterium]|nr:hypothetical protein [Planctomycetaceae bacterium]